MFFDSENILTASAEFFEKKISSKVEQEVWSIGSGDSKKKYFFFVWFPRSKGIYRVP